MEVKLLGNSDQKYIENQTSPTHPASYCGKTCASAPRNDLCRGY